MREKFLKFIDKFYGFFEMKSFDPENKKHKKIIQRRVERTCRNRHKKHSTYKTSKTTTIKQ